MLTDCRKRSSYTIASDSPRFPIDHLYRVHRTGIHMLYQSARARSSKSIRCNLVVLACSYWRRSWCHSQCQMGWAIHDCLDWKFDSSTALGSDRRHQKRHYETLHQAFTRQSLLLDLHSNRFLYGSIRNTLHMSCQSRRW